MSKRMDAAREKQKEATGAYVADLNAAVQRVDKARATGRMAPGKPRPAAMGEDMDEEGTRLIWRQFCADENKAAINNGRAALAATGAK